MSSITKEEKRPENNVKQKEEKIIETVVEIKPEKEVKNKAEVTPETKKNWRDKYRSGRRYSFRSPEEYIEYARSKSFSSLSVDHLSIDNSEEFILKKSKKRLTTSTEFALTSTEFGESLDDTADVTIEQIPDIEANNEQELNDVRNNDSYANRKKRHNRKKRGRCRWRKRRLCRKLTFSEIWRIVLLWAVIVAIALVFVFGVDENTSEAKLGTTNTIDAGCSLCPSGSSIHEPELEVFLGDFSCGLDEPVTVNTCGEMEELLGDTPLCDHDLSCFDFHVAVNKCCFLDTDDILGKELSQTKQSEEYFRVN